MKTIDKIISKIAIPTIAAAGILMILFFVISINDTNKENNGYIRVINCVISVPAKTRTQTDIESCYTTVEKDLGIHLQRYDTSAYRQ